jgi:glutathione S-transferase
MRVWWRLRESAVRLAASCWCHWQESGFMKMFSHFFKNKGSDYGVLRKAQLLFLLLLVVLVSLLNTSLNVSEAFCAAAVR